MSHFPKHRMLSAALQASVRATTTLLLLVTAATLHAQRANEHEGADFQRQRQAWYESQRAWPAADVNWEAILTAKLRVTSRSTGFSALSNALSGSWVPLGPNGFFGVGYWDSGPQLDAGRVDVVALHPTVAGTMLIASPAGGIWGSTSSGMSWTARTDNQCTLQMSTLTYDPVNPNLVYAGAAYSSGAAGCAILRSLDGGSSWNSYNGSLNFTAYNGGFINALYVDPGSAGTTNATTMMFSFGYSGIYRSTNSGSTWAHPLSFGYVTSIVGLAAQPGVVFAGVSDRATTTSTRSGLYRSADNGLTWTQVSTTIDFSSTGRFQLAVSAADPKAVFVIAASKSSTFQSVSRYDDATGAFATVSASGLDLSASGRTHFGSQGTYDLDIKVDPLDAKRIYIAGVRAYRSTDGGVTFAPMATEIHCDWHAIVIDPRNPRQLWAGTDGGVYTSTDGGDSWTSRSSGLAISMYYPGISLHPTDPYVVLGGLQDNGTLLANGTTIFNSIMGGDGGFAAIHPTSPTTLWTTCQWSSGPCIQKRVPSGTGYLFPNVEAGISTSDRAEFIPPLVMDPVNPSKLYFGTMRLYQTVNAGTVWTALTPDLSKGTGSIKTIAVAPSDTLTLYVGTSDGNVQYSHDGGRTFALASGLPNRAVTRVAIDRTNAQRALATFSGSGAAHVYLTVDGGVTWVNISGNLVDMPVNAGVILDDGPQHFFIGADVGVFETTDGGLTWSNTPAGLPNVQVNDIVYNPTTRRLVVATFGRGLFTYNLASATAVLRGDVNRDGVVNAFDALLIQQAVLGISLPSPLTSLPHGDTNCNNTLEAADVLIALRAAVGLTTAGSCAGTVR